MHESHHATGNHPYNQILKAYHSNKTANKEQIRIVGLTASIVQSKCTLRQFQNSKKTLEENFRFFKKFLVQI